MEWRRVCNGILACILACCLGYDVWSLARRTEARLNETVQADWRKAGRLVSGDDSVAFLVKDVHALHPVERTRLLAVNWNLLPRVARPCALSDLGGLCEKVIVTSAFLGKDAVAGLFAHGFCRRQEVGDACVWRRGEVPRGACSNPPAAPPRLWREMLGTGIVCALVVLVFAWRARWEGRWDMRRTLVMAVVFAVLSGVTLANGFLAPNGLGVYGGKAKLFFCSGGVPDGFWTNPDYVLYQPSYPPGLAILALVVDVLSGGCGDWFVQLLCPCALALLAASIVGFRPSWTMCLAAFAFALSPVSVWLASEFYAEPFAALCLVCGWRRVWTRGGKRGWLVMGCAGLFRHEGVVAAALLWCATRMFGTSGRVRWDGLACVLGLPLAWQVFRLSVVAELPDFDFRSLPAFETVAQLSQTAMISVLCFWEAGGAVLASALLAAHGCARSVCAAGVASALFLVGMCCALSFNRTSYFEWMASNCIPRLTWTMLAVVLSGVTVVRQSTRKEWASP